MKSVGYLLGDQWGVAAGTIEGIYLRQQKQKRPSKFTILSTRNLK
jgi:hypothetical protein